MYVATSSAPIAEFRQQVERHTLCPVCLHSNFIGSSTKSRLEDCPSFDFVQSATGHHHQNIMCKGLKGEVHLVHTASLEHVFSATQLHNNSSSSSNSKAIDNSGSAPSHGHGDSTKDDDLANSAGDEWRCKYHTSNEHDFFVNYRVKTDAALAKELALLMNSQSAHTVRILSLLHGSLMVSRMGIT